MSPDTVCQKCKATFSATKRAALRDWEQEHYDKSHTSLLVGGDGRTALVGSHQCWRFDESDDDGRNVAYRQYVHGVLNLELVEGEETYHDEGDE